MALFNFRIGTKLGLAAGAGVLLVGGMLANQVYGNALIKEAARSLVANFNNKGSAQNAETEIVHAEVAILQIAAAPSVEKLNESVRNSRAAAGAAAEEVEATANRAKRPQVKTLYGET